MVGDGVSASGVHCDTGDTEGPTTVPLVTLSPKPPYKEEPSLTPRTPLRPVASSATPGPDGPDGTDEAAVGDVAADGVGDGRGGCGASSRVALVGAWLDHGYGLTGSIGP